MRRRRRRAAVALGLLMAAMLAAGGCAAPRWDGSSTPGATSKPATGTSHTAGDAALTDTDPCATRLHELCGPLLLYYSIHHALPEALDELSSVGGGFDVANELTCPVSKKPYVYNRSGLPAPNNMGRLVIYDAAPVHNGFRWAIAIIEPQAREPLITRVVVVSEAAFKSHAHTQ
jgi:hypothetical protein